MSPELNERVDRDEGMLMRHQQDLILEEVASGEYLCYRHIGW